MKSFRTMTMLLAGGFLAMSTLGTAAAATHSTKDALTIKITTTSGTVWGKVTVDYKSGGKTHVLGSCNKASCTMHPPHMVKLTLHETAKDSATWPFHSWKLANGHAKAKTSMGMALTFEIQSGMATVWANYVVK